MAHNKNTKDLTEEVLLEAIEQWLDDAARHDKEAYYYLDREDSLWLEYDGISRHGFGEFLFDYKPQEAAEKLYSECEQFFDRFRIEAHLLDENRVSTVYLKDYLDDEARDKIIKEVAWMAIYMLITSMKIHIGNALERSFEDGTIFAEAGLASVLAIRLKEEGIKVNADVRSDIIEAAKKAAQERKETLSRLLQTLPHLLAKRESGRPKESRDNSRVHQERVNRNWHKLVVAVNALGDDLTRTDARSLLAQKVGISVRTLDRWLSRDFNMSFNVTIRRAQKNLNKGQKN